LECAVEGVWGGWRLEAGIKERKKCAYVTIISRFGSV
jgi:hypothetical protein